MGEDTEPAKKGGGYDEISNFARLNFPSSKVVARWATQDCMTLDSMPYIGTYSKFTPNLYTASGFNKWGMTSAMVSAMILSDLVAGKNCEYAKVFSPQRSVLHPQFAINIAESVLGLITPTAPRCSHLGCALKYNKSEHSWDCSCHGSRYDQSGKILDNPATKDKTFD